MTRFFLPLTLILSAFLLLPACAPAEGDAAQRSQRGPITQAEIEEVGVSSNAYDLVQRLRPNWLFTRGSGDIRVYVDGTRYGNTARSLGNIQVQNVRRVTKLTASEATTRFGTGHLQGAIVVETR